MMPPMMPNTPAAPAPDDSVDVKDILADARKALDQEKAESNPDPEVMKALEDAIAALERADSTDEDESPAAADKPMDDDMKASDGLVDTGILTGPIGGLKSFLIKKSQDKAEQ